MPRPKRWRVELTTPDRSELEGILRDGASERVMKRARVLLLASQGKPDREIARDVGLTVQTVYNIRRRYFRGGLKRALYDLPRRGRCLDDRLAMLILSLARQEGLWSLRRLAGRLAEMGVSVSHVTVLRAVRAVLRYMGFSSWPAYKRRVTSSGGAGPS